MKIFEILSFEFVRPLNSNPANDYDWDYTSEPYQTIVHMRVRGTDRLVRTAPLLEKLFHYRHVIPGYWSTERSFWGLHGAKELYDPNCTISEVLRFRAICAW